MTGFRLGDWVVRPEDGSLASPTATSRLEPLLMDLLVFLCSRAGQVVPKQDVLDAVWEGRFVSDETVKGSFYQLRRALGDNPREPRFIETLPKRGYRMIVEPVYVDTPAGSAQSEAQELYQKGRQALSGQANADSLRQARLYFERAIEADAENAAALSSLAQTYIMMVILGAGRGSEFLPRAKAAATRAAELNPNLSEAHVALGAILFVHDHDFASAESEFLLAIELRPEDSPAHRWYARFLSSQGRHTEAVAEVRRALDADPLSLAARRDLLEILFMARRYDDAIAEAHRLFDIAPNPTQIQLGMVWVYYLHHKDREALAAFKAGLASMGVAPALLEQAQQVFDGGGIREVFRLWTAVLEHEATLGQKNQIDLLVLYALLGENDRCFELIELFYRESHPYLLWMPESPIFDGLRSDPRYSEFIARLGLSASCHGSTILFRTA